MCSCKCDSGDHNRAFQELFLAQHGKDKFPKSRFSLQRKEGRYVHIPARKKDSSLSDYCSFHLVDDFVGVKQA